MRAQNMLRPIMAENAQVQRWEQDARIGSALRHCETDHSSGLTEKNMERSPRFLTQN